ncbi:MAG TPA: VanZ family protein [Rhizomicrobium sp.]|nr:VanZ family protein [Rhizomicrobium sp.]
MTKEQIAQWSARAAMVLFWPALALVVWGELAPHAPNVMPGISDKLQHFTAYFGLALLAAAALRTRRALLAAVVALVVLGGALEILQGLTGRDPEILDEAANSLGAAIGAFAGRGLIRLVAGAGRD